MKKRVKNGGSFDADSSSDEGEDEVKERELPWGTFMPRGDPSVTNVPPERAATEFKRRMQRADADLRRRREKLDRLLHGDRVDVQERLVPDPITRDEFDQRVLAAVNSAPQTRAAMRDLLASGFEQAIAQDLGVEMTPNRRNDAHNFVMARSADIQERGRKKMFAEVDNLIREMPSSVRAKTARELSQIHWLSDEDLVHPTRGFRDIVGKKLAKAAAEMEISLRSTLVMVRARLEELEENTNPLPDDGRTIADGDGDGDDDDGADSHDIHRRIGDRGKHRDGAAARAMRRLVLK